MNAKKHLFSIRAVMMLLVVLCSLEAWADKSGNCGANGDNVTYTYVESTHTLTISGTGAMADYTYGRPGWEECSFSSLVIESGVTSIGNYAFLGFPSLQSITFAPGSQLASIGNHALNGCTGLTSIEIPASVTSIGMNAFYGCTGLQSVTFASGSQLESIGKMAFGLCNNANLTSIEIPASLTSIGEYAFASCTGLQSVTFASGSQLESIGNLAFNSCTGLQSVTFAPESKLESIGEMVFDGCSGLTSIEIPASVKSIGTMAFSDCSGLQSITFAPGSKLESIGDYAFIRCNNTNLTSIEIPASVKSIGTMAFNNCSSLQSVTFASGSQLERIVDHAFDECSSLTSIEIPASVTSIGERAFAYCTGLRSATFASGSQLESIGKDAFTNCTGLTSIEIPASVTSIGESAFTSCTGLQSVTFASGSKLESIGKAAFASCYNNKLTSVEIPASVTSIGPGAFAYCAALQSVTFAPESKLESIGTMAFVECYNVTSIVIPASVTSIGPSAFAVCAALQSVIFAPGSKLESIGGYAFEDCMGLTTVIISATTPPTMEENVFNTESLILRIYVPKASESNYEAIDVSWCNKNAILPFPTLGSGNCGDPNENDGQNVSWELTGFPNHSPKNVTLTISGSGAMADYASGEQPWGSFDGIIDVIEINEGVTSIGSNAFNGCSNLKTITLPGREFNEGTSVTMNLAAEQANGHYWASFYNESATIKIDDNEEADAYTATVNGNVLNLQKLGKVIPAGNAVIIAGSDNNISMQLIPSVDLLVPQNDLKGMNERTKIATSAYSSNTIYVMGTTTTNGFGFHRYTGEYMPANKAFLALGSTSSAPLRMVFFDDDDTTTAIESISHDSAEQEGIYDLQGRKVNQPSRGLYIVNGKKMWIR